MTLLQLQPENSVITQGSIKVDGEELMILRESDILGIIEKPGKKSK